MLTNKLADHYRCFINKQVFVQIILVKSFYEHYLFYRQKNGGANGTSGALNGSIDKSSAYLIPENTNGSLYKDVKPGHSKGAGLHETDF